MNNEVIRMITECKGKENSEEWKVKSEEFAAANNVFWLTSKKDWLHLSEQPILSLSLEER